MKKTDFPRSSTPKATLNVSVSHAALPLLSKYKLTYFHLPATYSYAAGNGESVTKTLTDYGFRAHPEDP